MINDAQLTEFLQKLQMDQRTKYPLLLSEWEQSFLGTWASLPNSAFVFTEKRRKAIDRMWRKWGAELNFPHPLDAVHGGASVPASQPGCCNYLVKSDDGGPTFQTRCNAPAVLREAFGKMIYCQTHADHVKQRCPGIVLKEI